MSEFVEENSILFKTAKELGIAQYERDLYKNALLRIIKMTPEKNPGGVYDDYVPGDEIDHDEEINRHIKVALWKISEIAQSALQERIENIKNRISDLEKSGIYTI